MLEHILAVPLSAASLPLSQVRSSPHFSSFTPTVYYQHGASTALRSFSPHHANIFPFSSSVTTADRCLVTSSCLSYIFFLSSFPPSRPPVLLLSTPLPKLLAFHYTQFPPTAQVPSFFPLSRHPTMLVFSVIGSPPNHTRFLCYLPLATQPCSFSPLSRIATAHFLRLYHPYTRVLPMSSLTNLSQRALGVYYILILVWPV